MLRDTSTGTSQEARCPPDGVAEDVIIVNGEFPGPIIEANWGDNIEVNVHNEIYGPEETTVMHWHGMYQLGPRGPMELPPFPIVRSSQERISLTNLWLANMVPAGGIPICPPSMPAAFKDPP